MSVCTATFSFRNNSKDGLELLRRLKGNDWQAAGLGRGPCRPLPSQAPQRAHTGSTDQELHDSFHPRAPLVCLALFLTHGSCLSNPAGQVCAQPLGTCPDWPLEMCPCLVPASRTCASKVTVSFTAPYSSFRCALCNSGSTAAWDYDKHFKVKSFSKSWSIRQHQGVSTALSKPAITTPSSCHILSLPAPLWELS